MKEKTSPTQKVLNVWANILILWSFYRAHFRADLPVWFDEFFMKPLFFILPVFAYIRHIEGKPFFQSVVLRLKGWGQDIALGLVIGSTFLIIGFFAGSFKSGLANPLSVLFTVSALYTFLIALATAFSEEILSRGFVLHRLYEESKNSWQAIGISSLLFFFLHIPMLFTNEKMSGYLLLRVMTTDILLSVAVSILYLQRKSLTLPIIIHALYNLSIVLFI